MTRPLQFELKETLPRRIAVGPAGTLHFIRGWCFHPDLALRSLSIAVDGHTHPVEAHSQPRSDLHRRAIPPNDSKFHSFRSGFWAYVPLAAGNGAGPVQLELRAELEDGSETSASLGQVELVPANSLETAVENGTGDMPHLGGAATRSREGPLVAIAMATFNPPPDLFERQLESIRNQTHTNWICVISDDMSRPAAFEQLERLVAVDDRFVLSRSRKRLGFYRNFERALALVPAEAEFVSLADQDDRWEPDKLETLLNEMDEGITLAYSDARIVDAEGEVISDTYWTQRPTNYTDLTDLVIANTITGAASIFRRELLDSALPFPEPQSETYHDHWLAIVALASGDLRYVERPLYDYIQHEDQALGHIVANRLAGDQSRWRLRLSLLNPGKAQGRIREILAWWSAMYFADVCRTSLFARMALERCADRISPGKRRGVERLIAAERSVRGVAWLVWRRLRRLGRKSPTLNNELRLARAILWRRLIDAGVIGRAPDTVAQPGAGAVSGGDEWLNLMERKLEPLRLQVSQTAPVRVNLIIPDLDLDHFFGGYIAKFNLARRLAERGRSVRIVTVDGEVVAPKDWRERLSSFEGLDRIEELELHNASLRSIPFEVSPQDTFIATTWWTAELAKRAVPELGRQRFVYLIQEYEPFTYPMGSMAALARASYDAPHSAVFSTELLRDWFRDERLGIFAEGDGGDDHAIAFENALTSIDPAPAEELARQRRLLFYARPEWHATRNMYELGRLGLAAAVRDRVFTGDWEFYGIGAQARRTVDLGDDAKMELLARGGQAEHATLLRSCSVGLALMYTPHPSLVPLEMASAGMLVVTNTYANKTAEALRAISPNLIAVEPTIEGVSRGLQEAAYRVEDVEARLAGADVNWARSWDESFDDTFMDRFEALLDAT